MMRTTTPAVLLLAAVVIATIATSASTHANDEIDPASGLIMAPGWEVAAAHCGACHSHALVASQRGDAAFWRSIIRWMQKTQNLWLIPEPQESELIEYLAANYNETDWGRRPALPASLLPGHASD